MTLASLLAIGTFSMYWYLFVAFYSKEDLLVIKLYHQGLLGFWCIVLSMLYAIYACLWNDHSTPSETPVKDFQFSRELLGPNPIAVEPILNNGSTTQQKYINEEQQIIYGFLETPGSSPIKINPRTNTPSPPRGLQAIDHCIDQPTKRSSNEHYVPNGSDSRNTPSNEHGLTISNGLQSSTTPEGQIDDRVVENKLSFQEENLVKKVLQYALDQISVFCPYILILSSAALNALTQVLLAFALDYQIALNIVVFNNHSIALQTLVLAQVLAHSLVMVAPAMMSHFICDQDKTSEDVNLAASIYQILVAILFGISLSLVVFADTFVTSITLAAFLSLAMRLWILKHLLQSHIGRLNCLKVTLIYLWCEFGICLLSSLFFGDQLRTFISTRLVSIGNLIQDTTLVLLYTASLVALHKAVLLYPLFTLVNEFILAPLVVVFIGTMAFLLVTQKVYSGIVLGFCLTLVGIRQFLNWKKHSKKQEFPLAKSVQLFFEDSKTEKLLTSSTSTSKQFIQQSYEYYIVENEISLLLKKRPCLDPHYKNCSIQHFSLRFYSIQSFEMSDSTVDEQSRFIKAIEKYQQMIYTQKDFLAN